MIVAIDGPAGAGKSTVARRLAERLGFRYLDTGAMYRALTWLATRERLDLGDGPRSAARRENPVELRPGRPRARSTAPTSPRRSARRASTAWCPSSRGIRRCGRDARRQRELAQDGDAVIEGRDIGTVVVPDAEVKVYLTADPRCARAGGSPSGRNRRRRSRHRPAAPRRERRGADASLPRTPSRSTRRPRGGRRRRADRGARP